MNKGKENKTHFSKFLRFYKGVHAKRTLSIAIMVLNALFYIFEKVM